MTIPYHSESGKRGAYRITNILSNVTDGHNFRYAVARTQAAALLLVTSPQEGASLFGARCTPTARAEEQTPTWTPAGQGEAVV